MRPLATNAVARPVTVSARDCGRRANVTTTPTGHHDGKSSSVVSLGVASDAHSRPPGALSSDESKGAVLWPAAVRSNVGFHAPKEKPKHCAVSAAALCAAESQNGKITAAKLRNKTDRIMRNLYDVSVTPCAESTWKELDAEDAESRRSPRPRTPRNLGYTRRRSRDCLTLLEPP